MVVFRYPEEPEVSYIKRLVGLPGEELRIWFGDIYVKPPGGQEFHLERKPLRHQDAMQMMVYDDRHRAESLKDRPEWRRWSAATPGSWTEEPSGTFAVAAAAGAGGRAALPPPRARPRAVGRHRQRPRAAPAAAAHADHRLLLVQHQPHAATSSLDRDGWWMQPHWVGDLSLSATLQVKEARGVVRFELIEGGVANRCEIDLATGVATLQHGAETLGQRVRRHRRPGLARRSTSPTSTTA